MGVIEGGLLAWSHSQGCPLRLRCRSSNGGRKTTRLIIEARIDDGGDAEDGAVTLAVVERCDGSLSKLGLTLAEGRTLLAAAQAALVSQQVDGWISGETNCRR